MNLVTKYSEKQEKANRNYFGRGRLFSTEPLFDLNSLSGHRHIPESHYDRFYNIGLALSDEPTFRINPYIESQLTVDTGFLRVPSEVNFINSPYIITLEDGSTIRATNFTVREA